MTRMPSFLKRLAIQLEIFAKVQGAVANPNGKHVIS